MASRGGRPADNAINSHTQSMVVKRKKGTASSKSGAHFGHYKTGANHDDINMLTASIPLQSGFL